jgi:hypothetical protein
MTLKPLKENSDGALGKIHAFWSKKRRMAIYFSLPPCPDRL